MECHKYKDEDFDSIRAWYLLRGMDVLKEDFPKVGFIVPGIAAGFIMQTDTKSAILEPFIANPDTDWEDREEALTLIMGDLLDAAQDMGYTRVFGFSSNLPMLRRALEWGFQVLEKSTTVVKELDECHS